MFSALLILTAAAAPTCPTTIDFGFIGQPDCVTVAYDDGRINLHSACTEPLLVDASLQLHTPSAPALPIIPADTTVQLRDLSFFTLGMGGELFKVIAYLEEVESDCGDTGEPARDSG
jgi:hypothetical protein